MLSFIQYQVLWEETRLRSLAKAAKEGIKDKAALAMIAAPVPGSAPIGVAKIALNTYRKYKQIRKAA